MAKRKNRDNLLAEAASEKAADDDPHLGEMKQKLEDHEGLLSDLESDRNKLVEKHDSPGQIEQMRREINGNIADVKDKIADIRSEILDYENNKDADRDKQMLEGLHDLNKEGAEHLYGGHGKGHGEGHAESNTPIHTSSAFGLAPDWSFENMSTHATAQPDAALLEQQQAATIQSDVPQAPHGPVGDFYPPGSHDAPLPVPPDLDGTTTSVGIAQMDSVHANTDVGTPGFEHALLGVAMVAGTVSSWAANRDGDAGQQRAESGLIPLLPESGEPAPAAETQSTSQHAPAQQPAPQQAAPAIPPTPDSRPVAETTQPSPAPPSPDPER
jgi:hypothetical protein